MIQRIQTLFLIAATVFLSFTVFFPFAELVRTSDQMLYSLDFNGLIASENQGELVFNVLPVSILIIVTLIITVATIFLYKKRMLQIRLCIFNAILQLGIPSLIFYYVRMAEATLPGVSSYNVVFVFPVASAILIFLALRAIARDEALIRSLDRLR